MEVEAVQSVYEDDCLVFEKYPPHLHVHIKPRTADVSSQQFVEAVLGIRAGPQYPDDPPHISIIDSKGLDEKRQNHLISIIRDKACELTSYLMLVTLCEEAAERLSSMNHPDGDCPLCLSPLVEEDIGNDTLPFMKLMSCFHCFHCECIFRWWNWLQMEKELHPSTSSLPNSKRMNEEKEVSVGTCPVCRKSFHAKDIEHVLDLVGNYSQLSSSKLEVNEEEGLLHSDSENIRKQKIEAILKLQQENNGLIEPKKTEVLLPGMFLPQSIEPPPPPPAADSANESNEQQNTTSAHNTETNSYVANRPCSSRHKNLGMRKHRRQQNSRKQGNRQWIKKENDTTN